MTIDFRARAALGVWLMLAVAAPVACARSPRAVRAPDPSPDVAPAPPAQDAFWRNLQAHCGRAFPGRLGVEPPGDEMLSGEELLIAHFRDCREREMKIAFHIEQEGGARWDRSRTWVLRRIDDLIELRHDHRHEDGTADETTWYGAFSRTPGTANRQEFEYLDGTPMPGVHRGWRLEIERDRRYSYGTIRDGEWRWRVDFDLSRTVDIPPPAWGHDNAAEAARRATPAPMSPAGTDIHLIPISVADGRVTLGSPRNITNRAGYDNQPSFTPDGAAVLYTSIRENSRADIYRFEIATGQAAQLTTGPESEYSPTVMPAGDAMSVVRVERDSTQRLWRFPFDGSAPSLVFEPVAPVGYHAWADSTRAALFVLGAPPTLRLADTRTGEALILASDIGRAMQRMPGTDTITYMVRVPPSQWRVVGLDFRTAGSRHMTVALEGSQDFAWTPDGTLLMAGANSIHSWRPGQTGWTLVARFDQPALQRITRMAVGGGLLAVVGDR